MIAERNRTDQKILTRMLKRVDVTEIFSPPRIAAMCARMGLVGGKSMDLATGYDFSEREDRKRAISSITREEPWLVICSPRVQH